MIFIDTNIVIDYLKNKECLSGYKHQNLFINDIVIMELYQGAKNKNDLAFIKKEISGFQVLKMNQEIVTLAKQMVEHYYLSHNMKIMDALIASTAMVYDLDLMTLNRKDFVYLKQLNLVT